MKKRFPAIITMLLVLVSLLALLSGCGQAWTCDECGKEFFGTAYYGFSGTETYCEDCAKDYWMPLPYQNYKK